MAIVLPRGVLKNYSDEPIRQLSSRTESASPWSFALTGNMFKPFTNTKTCVLFLEKRLQELSDLADADDDNGVVYAVSGESLGRIAAAVSCATKRTGYSLTWTKSQSL